MEAFDTTPLADRLRPPTLDDFVGQNHITAAGKPLRQLLDRGELPSLVLWGPPGTGKTTLARLIASRAKADFVPFSAVSSGLPELRQVIKRAEQNQRLATKTVVFIDEIHRWNKAQQDALLPHVETGTITLIGATTENPSFEVIGALLSRAHVWRLHELEENDLRKVLKRALTDREHGLGAQKLKIEPGAEQFLVTSASGDARTLLNTLELVAKTVSTKGKITVGVLEDTLARKAILYDKKGEEHYNVISAFIKSMRGSDTDAAVYYLARMLEAGEDPKFIARRMVIFASEDVGNADPHAFLVAVAAFEAVLYVGLPEARINLSQAATYLASAPKSNAAYAAINGAQSEAKHSGALPVPLHLRNAPTKLMKDEGYKKGYQYAHGQADAVVTHHHLPEKLVGKRFYEPGGRGHEAKIREKLEQLRKLRAPHASSPRKRGSK